jgi:hypothetical protein
MHSESFEQVTGTAIIFCFCNLPRTFISGGGYSDAMQRCPGIAEHQLSRFGGDAHEATLDRYFGRG